jgi:ketosteroid isomerase-like protein
MDLVRYFCDRRERDGRSGDSSGAGPALGSVCCRGDQDAEHAIYHDDVITDYPQSGERIHGRRNLQALRSHHPAKLTFTIRRILGSGDLWITEYVIDYDGKPASTISIMEFHDGKVVHETQYFADPFAPPSWRAEWVESMPQL